jgi:hypothetical protein
MHSGSLPVAEAIGLLPPARGTTTTSSHDEERGHGVSPKSSRLFFRHLLRESRLPLNGSECDAYGYWRKIQPLFSVATRPTLIGSARFRWFEKSGNFLLK